MKQSRQASDNSTNGKKIITYELILVVIGLALVVIFGVYLIMVPRDTPAKQSATDALTERANQLPIELRHAITRDLSITPRQYLKEALASDSLLQQASAYQATHTGQYAGAYLDWSTRPHILSTERSRESDIAIRPLSVLTDRLAAIQAWIETLSPSDRSQVISSSIDIASNTIIVSLLQTPDNHHIAVPTDLSEGVQLVYLPLNQSMNVVSLSFVAPSKPLGDIRQPSPQTGDGFGIDSPSTVLCTLGFAVEAPDKSISALTYGHCLTDILQHTSGTLLIEDYSRQGRLATSPVIQQPANNLIPVPSSVAKSFAHSGIRSKDWSLHPTGTTTAIPGAPLCKYGRTSHWTCGRVLSTSAHFRGGPDKSFVQGIATDTCIRPGDSGGPMIIGTKAVGITASVDRVQGECGTNGAYQIGGSGISLNTIFQELPGYKLRF